MANRQGITVIILTEFDCGGSEMLHSIRQSLGNTPAGEQLNWHLLDIFQYLCTKKLLGICKNPKFSFKPRLS